MNTRINSNISFGKTLQATCNILDRNKVPQKAYIYELDDAKEDMDYFFHLKNEEDWIDSGFLDYLACDTKFIIYSPKESIYVLETKNGDCLGLMTTKNDKARGTLTLEVLETAPSCTKQENKKEQKAKYIGETLLSFLIQKAQNNNYKKIVLDSTQEAYDFYGKKCHFAQSRQEESRFVLYVENGQKLINQNERHTQAKIDFKV